MKLLKITIDPIKVKSFDNQGNVTEKVTHYMGFIYGIAEKGIKNFYLNNDRIDMQKEMFLNLENAGLKLT